VFCARSVATALYVDDALSNYKGGVFSAYNPNNDDANHAVAAVGYDDTKVRRSWQARGLAVL
jgi:C1A family cysteine protease